ESPADGFWGHGPVWRGGWPVAIGEDLAIVRGGNPAWLLTRDTPWRARAARFGAVSWLPARERSPSATKITTLCGTAAGEVCLDCAWARTGVATATSPIERRDRMCMKNPPVANDDAGRAKTTVSVVTVD